MTNQSLSVIHCVHAPNVNVFISEIYQVYTLKPGGHPPDHQARGGLVEVVDLPERHLKVHLRSCGLRARQALWVWRVLRAGWAGRRLRAVEDWEPAQGKACCLA